MGILRDHLFEPPAPKVGDRWKLLNHSRIIVVDFVEEHAVVAHSEATGRKCTLLLRTLTERYVRL